MMRCAALWLGAALALAGCSAPREPGGQTGEETAEAASEADTPAMAPTAAMGEQIFKRCAACHSIDKGGRNGIGPNLHGIAGRALAAQPGFAYSAAMQASGGRWDEATLDQFLTAPREKIPGTRMAFAGINDPADRKALILYLQAQSQ